jgi:hypothetical protein
LTLKLFTASNAISLPLNTKQTWRVGMKIAEVINNTAQPMVVQPSALQRQTRINKIVQQLAAADAQDAQTGEPTADELFLARKIFKQQKDQANASYAQRQQQQANNTAIAASTVATTATPSAKRQKRS